MNTLKTLLILVVLSAGATSSFAASHAVAPAVAPTTMQTVLPSTDGEVRKIDLENKKITLKHNEIKNLDMPGMTMVFQVKDPAVLETVKAGDKVKFTVEKVNGAMTILSLEKTK